jgi:hypothetical protein
MLRMPNRTTELTWIFYLSTSSNFSKQLEWSNKNCFPMGRSMISPYFSKSISSTSLSASLKSPGPSSGRKQNRRPTQLLCIKSLSQASKIIPPHFDQYVTPKSALRNRTENLMFSKQQQLSTMICLPLLVFIRQCSTQSALKYWTPVFPQLEMLYCHNGSFGFE